MAAITDLAAASSVAATDLLVISQSGTDRKVTADKFARVVANNGFTAGQTVNGIDIGATANDGLSKPRAGELLLKVGTAFSMAQNEIVDIGVAFGISLIMCYVPGTAFMVAIINWTPGGPEIVTGGTYFVSSSSTANKINVYVSGGRAYLKNGYATAAQVQMLMVGTNT
mgnify:FL=1